MLLLGENFNVCQRPRSSRLRRDGQLLRGARLGAASSPTVGVVLIDHGSRKAESNEQLHGLVALYKAQTGRSVVHAAHMELASPTLADAFSACVADGADTVVVSPYFLSPGRHWQEDLPSQAAAAAAQHPGVRFLVAAPLGLHPLVTQILESRLTTCLATATTADDALGGCDVCRRAGVRCQLK